MGSDSEHCVDTPTIVIDDGTVGHSTTMRTNESNSTENNNSIQYDDTKLAISCCA